MSNNTYLQLHYDNHSCSFCLFPLICDRICQQALQATRHILLIAARMLIFQITVIIFLTARNLVVQSVHRIHYCPSLQWVQKVVVMSIRILNLLQVLWNNNIPVIHLIWTVPNFTPRKMLFPGTRKRRTSEGILLFFHLIVLIKHVNRCSRLLIIVKSFISIPF